MLTLYLNLFLSARISSEDSQSSSLFLIHLNYVILFHLESLRGLIIIDPSPVEQKPQGCNGDTNPLGVGLLQFPHLSSLLHPEVDFIGILSNNLQLDVFSVISSSPSLFLVNLNDIVLFHLESLGVLIIIDPPSIKQKTERCDWDSNPLGVRLLEFAHLSGLLHPEVDFIGILSNHLQFDVFRIISSSPSLFLVNLNDIVLFHLQGFGVFIIIDPSSIKEKSERCDWDSTPLGVRFLEFAHLGGLLHSEVNFIGVLSDDLQFDVFRVITGTSGLLLVNLNNIILFHLEGLRVFIIIDPSSIKEETERCDWHSDPLRVGLLKFSHLGGLLDPEVDFIGILSNDFKLDVFRIISSSSSLFLVNLNDIVLFHFKGFWCLIIIDPSSIKEKTERCNGDTNPFRVGLFQFAHLSGLFNPEVDLIGILSHNLELDVFSIITGTSSLFLVNLNDIVLLHLQGLGVLIIIDPSSIKQKAERCNWDTNPLRVGFLEFAHLGGLLHSKVDFIGILSHDLELDVFRVVSSHFDCFLLFVWWKRDAFLVFSPVVVGPDSRGRVSPM